MVCPGVHEGHGLPVRAPECTGESSGLKLFRGHLFYLIFNMPFFSYYRVFTSNFPARVLTVRYDKISIHF